MHRLPIGDADDRPIILKSSAENAIYLTRTVFACYFLEQTHETVAGTLLIIDVFTIRLPMTSHVTSVLQTPSSRHFVKNPPVSL